MVDYGIVSCSLYEDILNFRVFDLSVLSDHCPISLTLRCHPVKQVSKKSTHIKALNNFVWDEEGKKNIFLFYKNNLIKQDCIISDK